MSAVLEKDHAVEKDEPHSLEGSIFGNPNVPLARRETSHPQEMPKDTSSIDVITIRHTVAEEIVAGRLGRELNPNEKRQLESAWNTTPKSTVSDIANAVVPAPEKKLIPAANIAPLPPEKRFNIPTAQPVPDLTPIHHSVSLKEKVTNVAHKFIRKAAAYAQSHRLLGHHARPA